MELSEETRRRLMQAHLDLTTDEERPRAGWVLLGALFCLGFWAGFFGLIYWAFFM